MGRRSMRGAALAMAGLVAAATAHAAAIQKGSSIFAVQVTRGDADLATPGAIVYPFVHSELGVQGQFWHFFAEDYAFNIAGGIGFFKESNKDSLDQTVREYTQDSWHVRVGGDRVAHITTRFHIFFGPGVELWRGDADLKYPTGLATEAETPTTTRIAIAPRIAVHLKMGESVGLMGQIGQYFGWARAKDDATRSKTTWWPSGTQGAGGLAFNF